MKVNIPLTYKACKRGKNTKDIKSVEQKNAKHPTKLLFEKGTLRVPYCMPKSAAALSEKTKMELANPVSTQVFEKKTVNNNPRPKKKGEGSK